MPDTLYGGQAQTWFNFSGKNDGVAAAYDMVRFGDATAVILADVDGDLAATAAAIRPARRTEERSAVKIAGSPPFRK